MESDGKSEARAAGGLITQRLAAERGRVTAIVYLLWGSMLLATGVSRGVPSDALGWILAGAAIIPGIALMVYGVLTLRAHKADH
ncbi:hypothetical protein ACIGEP_16745 [Microbacterium sp. NPDC077663]|uniref:hypothetical protein n=1 Tax=Microbacterium sp. NPDC077663 TaxID=3364189 RepID=UPI0037C50A99